jgi:hypothetical protein
MPAIRAARSTAPRAEAIRDLWETKAASPSGRTSPHEEWLRVRRKRGEDESAAFLNALVNLAPYTAAAIYALSRCC